MQHLTACGLVTVDRHGVIVDVNPTILTWLNSERADVLGRPMETFLTLRLPMGDSNVPPTDATLHGISGVVRPVVVGSLDAPDADGTQRIAVYDVSTRSAFTLGFRGAEAKTERGRQRLQILLNSAVGFGDVRTETDAAELLADVAQRAFAASFASVHLRQPDGVTLMAGVNPLAAHWPEGFRPTGSTTLMSGKVVVVRTPDEADAYTPGVSMSDVYRAGGISSAIASPMRSKGETVGAMICYFENPREFDEEAIPLAEGDGNPGTAADPSWTPLATTPNFPEYPSAHACHSAAVVTALDAFFGTDKVAFTLDSRTTHATREYRRLHDIVADVDLARVLVGFHFLGSDQQGARLGSRVGGYVARHDFQRSG